MHRTNIYLTVEQERALDARARVSGTTRSAVLRSILDRELSSGAAPDPALQEALGTLADHYDTLVSGVFDGDPDLHIER